MSECEHTRKLWKTCFLVCALSESIARCVYVDLRYVDLRYATKSYRVNSSEWATQVPMGVDREVLTRK